MDAATQPATTSATSGATASVEASKLKVNIGGAWECLHCHVWFANNEDFNSHLPCKSMSEESRIRNGREERKVAAYVTTSGKHIGEHWRPVRSCRSYAESGQTADALRAAKRTATVAKVEQVAPIAPPQLVSYEIQATAPASNGATQVASALIPDVPEYYPQNGEVDLMQKAIAAELNVILTGPTGCGKTHLTERICMLAQREMFTIQGGAGATYERIIAQKDLVSDGSGGTITKLTKGILPTAMERGAVLYLDEPNAIPSEVLFYLFSAMDYRRTITLESGEVVKAAKGFVVAGAMNEGAGYAGTALLNAAFRQRAVVIDMSYLPPERERDVLTHRTGIKADIARKLVDVAARLRAGVIKTPIGTRALIACAMLHEAGVNIHAAIECAITNQIAAQFANERKAVSDVVAAIFGLEAK